MTRKVLDPYLGDGIWYGNLPEKHAHGDVTSDFVWKFRGNMPFTDSGTPILCGSLDEKTHIEISQEPFCVKIKEKCRTPR